MVYGVTVTLLILVQSFKVRILVDQQKARQKCRAFLFLSIKKASEEAYVYKVYNLDFKRYYRSCRVIY